MTIILNYTVNENLIMTPVQAHLNVDLIMPLWDALGIIPEEREQTSTWGDKLVLMNIRRKNCPENERITKH